MDKVMIDRDLLRRANRVIWRHFAVTGDQRHGSLGEETNAALALPPLELCQPVAPPAVTLDESLDAVALLPLDAFADLTNIDASEFIDEAAAFIDAMTAARAILTRAGRIAAPEK